MDSDEAKGVIHNLVLKCMNAELSTKSVRYRAFFDIITELMLGNKDPDRTTHILTTLLNEATALNKSEEWLLAELAFESTVEHGTDRPVAARNFVKRVGRGSDASLDLYNERLNRFK